MSFALVEHLQEKAVPVDQVCRVLRISRSGYCAAQRRSRVQPTDSKHALPITPNVLDLFARKVVGWAMAPDMQAGLVCRAGVPGAAVGHRAAPT